MGLRIRGSQRALAIIGKGLKALNALSVGASRSTVRGKQHSVTATYLCGDPVLGRFTCYAEVIADTTEVSGVGTKIRMTFEFDEEKMVTSTHPLLISGSSPSTPLSIVSVMVRK